MKKLIFILAIGASFMGCKKEVDANEEEGYNNNPPKEYCEESNTGKLKLVSTQIDDFYVYLDDKYIGLAMAAKVNTFHDIKAGFKVVDLINKEDWNDSYQGTIEIKMCEVVSADF